MINLIGLGNRLRGDDGIGPIVLNEFGKRHGDKPFQLVEAGSDAFSVLEYLIGSQPNIVIDCANMGLPAGTVKCFRLKKDILKTVDAMISLHGFSFAEIYNMAESLGKLAPTSFIGVQPATIEFGQKLSPQVERAIPQILDLIIEEADYYAKKNFDH